MTSHGPKIAFYYTHKYRSDALRAVDALFRMGYQVVTPYTTFSRAPADAFMREISTSACLYIYAPTGYVAIDAAIYAGYAHAKGIALYSFTSRLLNVHLTSIIYNNVDTYTLSVLLRRQASN